MDGQEMVDARVACGKETMSEEKEGEPEGEGDMGPLLACWAPQSGTLCPATLTEA